MKRFRPIIDQAGVPGIFWLIGITCLGPLTVWAEPPTWDDIASKIYLNFEHIAVPAVHGDDYAGGIWAFDPTTLEGRRVRQFDAESCTVGNQPYLGQDLHLETENGLLVIQTWPTELRFEPGTWRLIGRWPTTPAETLLTNSFHDPEAATQIGWTLQGPMLDESDLEGSGFEPGIFGLATCIRSIITAASSDFKSLFFYPCAGFEPIQGNDPVVSDGPLLMRSPISPPDPYDAELVRDLPEDAYYFTPAQISWDRERKGFWYPVLYDDAAVSFSLFPAREAQIFEPEFDLDLDLGIPPNHYLDLDLLYFDSNSQVLLGHGLVRNSDNPTDAYTLSFLADATDLDPLFALPKNTRNHDLIENPFSSWLPKFTMVPPGYCPAEDVALIDATPVSATSFRQSPEMHEQLIPVIAEVEGRHGTFWSTDIWLFNPSDEATTVHLRRLSNDVETTLTLGPRASTHIPNVLSWVGGGQTGDGATHDALYVSAPFRFGEHLRIDGKIWTEKPDTGGTFGHALQAVPAPYGYSNHAQYAMAFNGELASVQPPFQRYAAFLQLDTKVSGQFRHNIGIVNPYEEVLEIALMWGYDDEVVTAWQLWGPPNGFPEEARVLLQIPPKQIRIYDIEALFPEEISGTWPAKVGVLGQRPAPIWFSMIDETTQDATFVPYTNYQLPALHYDERQPMDGTCVDFLDYDRSYRLALPTVAHTPGVNASRWTTTLYGYMQPDPSEYPSGPIAALHLGPEDVCSDGQPQYVPGVMGSDPEIWSQYSQENDLGHEPGYYRCVHPDVVRSFSGCENATRVLGGLEIVTGSWFSGFSRTFTTRNDGGTFGSMLPLYPAGGWPIQHFAGIEISPDTRINLGFFNGDHDHDIIHRISLYDASGGLTAEREFVLNSLDSRQMEIHDFFPGVDLAEGTYGLTVMPLDGVEVDGTPFQGHSWAYVSIIDNRTNDPVNLW